MRKALKVGALVLSVAGYAGAEDEAERRADHAGPELWVYPLPTIAYAALGGSAYVLALGGSVQPGVDLPLTFEVASAYFAYPDPNREIINVFRVGTRLYLNDDDRSGAWFFVEPKAELAGLVSWNPRMGGGIGPPQSAAILGADVGVRFWPRSRIYVALVVGASAGACFSCRTDEFVQFASPALLPGVNFSWNLNFNLLRVGWVF